MERVSDGSEEDRSSSRSDKKSKRSSEVDEADKRSLKKESKKIAKDHKSSSKKKQKRSHADSDSGPKELVTVINSIVAEVPVVNINSMRATVVPVSKLDFFANLAALENQKPSVGTVHTVGKKVDDKKKDTDWTCPKCSTANQRNSHQCHKCKAIKRMTEYR